MTDILRIARKEVDRLAAIHNVTGIQVKVNNRLSRSMGRFVIKRMRSTQNDTRTIELAGVMRRWEEDAVLEVVRHEFAHAIEWDRHGTAGHGRNWQHYARLLGAVPRATAEVPERMLATANARATNI